MLMKIKKLNNYKSAHKPFKVKERVRQNLFYRHYIQGAREVMRANNDNSGNKSFNTKKRGTQKLSHGRYNYIHGAHQAKEVK